jgi:uncharacterized membrane protein SpoIIM required for sporulation
MQKPWLKAFIWTMTTFFFFLASGVLISMFKPGPTETEVMRFMESMMGAMNTSLMGLAMGIKHDAALQRVITISVLLTFPMILTGVLVGIAIRLTQQGDKPCSTRKS